MDTLIDQKSKTDIKVKHPKKAKIIIYNDHQVLVFIPIYFLKKVFKLKESKIKSLLQIINQNGKAEIETVTLIEAQNKMHLIQNIKNNCSDNNIFQDYIKTVRIDNKADKNEFIQSSKRLKFSLEEVDE